MKIGLFFGSYNPVHVGHMIIAKHMAEHTNLDQIWMIVSPQNPFKSKASLAPDYDRLHLLDLAIGNQVAIRSSNIEFSLPQPSYTIDTLAYLFEKYPHHNFSLIMGGDNLENFHKWKNAEIIISKHDIYVYQRPGAIAPEPYRAHPRIHFVQAPLLDISASYIREQRRQGKSVQYLVPDTVFEYLETSNLYRT